MTAFRHVLCPIDLSGISPHAVDHAAALARAYGARLTLLYVFVNRPTMDLPPLVLEHPDRDRLAAAMRDAAANVPAAVEVQFLVQEAESAHEEILRQLSQTGAGLLVMGSHGRSGFQRFFLGSVTEKVIRKAGCPTLVVPPRAPDVAPDAPVQFRRILCPVDFSESSLAALDRALDVAHDAGARLTLLHVIEMPPELREDAMGAGFDVDRIRAAAEAEALRRLRDLAAARARPGCTIETVVAEGRSYREVLRAAAERTADLIVMGVHGRGAIDLAVFGSTTHHVIRAASCPVLVVRQG